MRTSGLPAACNSGQLLIRDPVHGDITLTGEEVALLGTWPMQRLRGIKQVGTAYLVYPGCLHTRFEHGLGTLAVTARLLAALAARGHHLDPDLARLARIAALVHDVSHLPFGHTFEDETLIFPRHDTPVRLRPFLVEGELGEVLDRFGLREDVFALLSGHGHDRGIPPWVGQLVAGTVDADLLDYVRRDAYYAGLSQTYDDRVFAYFDLDGGDLVFNLTRHGMERPDARSELSHLLRLRYFLSERVYFHHAKVAAGAMVARAVEAATQQGLSWTHLLSLSDQGLLENLPSLITGNVTPGAMTAPAAMPTPGAMATPGATTARDDVAGLPRAVLARKLYKRAYVLSLHGIGEKNQQQLIARYRLSTADRRLLETELAQAGGSPVIVYCAEATAMKEAAMPVLTAHGRAHFDQPEVGGQDVCCLGDMYRRLWRFYVFAPEENRDAVGRAAEHLLGFPNEYAAGSS